MLSELCRSGDKLVANTLHVLLDKGRMALVADVQTELEAQAVVEDAVVEVEVTSAIDLHPEAEATLVRRLEKVLGRRVSLVKNVRPEVIGGLVLRVGDRRRRRYRARPHPPAAPSTRDGRPCEVTSK